MTDEEFKNRAVHALESIKSDAHVNDIRFGVLGFIGFLNLIALVSLILSLKGC